jgi:hypothetical protein
MFTGPFFETAKTCLESNEGIIIMGYVSRDQDLNNLLHKTAEKFGFEATKVNLRDFYEEGETIPSSEYVPQESLELLLFCIKKC